MSIERLCKSCGQCFRQYSTSQTRCPKCSYNRYAKPRKPIKRIGKIAKKWVQTRNQWIKDNPPNHLGCYICGICGGILHVDELTLDHVVPRSNFRNYDKRDDYSNLQPAHYFCNTEKGSKHSVDTSKRKA